MAEKKKGLFSKKPAEMKPTPRKQLPGYLADALINARNFADRARVPESVPLLGGLGLGSMFLGQAPEEINELSYGNSPIQINPYAGRTGSYVPEMKRGRGAQVFDALSLLSLPGARTVAGGLFGGGLTPGVDAAATVYHGSPFKFDRFDSSKIGTGEGAQAYGHGLYLADSPDVAGGYATNLANRDIANQGRLNAHANAQRLAKVAGDPAYAADDLRFVLGNDPQHPQKQLLTDTLRFLESGDYAKPLANPGNLYKVDLPDEHIARMLDWDKPLSQQAPEVQKALASTKNKQLRAIVDYAGSPYSMPGIEGEVKTMGAAIKLLGMNTAPAKGSKLLAKHGIPGIRYLDGGSRGAGQGTSNYVIFPGNESLLTILERNGRVVDPIYRDPFGNTLDETIR